MFPASVILHSECLLARILLFGDMIQESQNQLKLMDLIIWESSHPYTKLKLEPLRSPLLSLRQRTGVGLAEPVVDAVQRL